ncbi:MAG: Nucleoporin nup84 [Phylliscum demangeonii]|nr:MAG: Nucleoporin nup84 [Phylliscum demangeonii]
MHREENWHFTNAESRSEDSREDSAEPMVLEDPNGGPYEMDDDGLGDDMNGHPSQPITPEEYEELYNPLQDTAERVGPELERFAEQLEQLQPRREENPQKRYDRGVELVEEYQKIAQGAVDRLRKEHASAQRTMLAHKWRLKYEGVPAANWTDRLAHELAHGRLNEQPPGSLTSLDDLEYWTMEERTWSLCRRLLEFRCPQPWVDQNQEIQRRLSSIGPVHKYSSERKVWDRFLVADDLARERDVVLRWLEDGAERSGEDVDVLLETLETELRQGQSMWASGGTHTRETIKAQKRLQSWSGTLDPSDPAVASRLSTVHRKQALVTQLDPDAVTRQGRALERPDEVFERCVWLVCWEMLRRGKRASEIRAWCQDRADLWRAVSLRGRVPSWDALLDGTEDPDADRDTDSVDEQMAEGNDAFHLPPTPARSRISGNRSRALWRRMCLALGQSGGSDDYERAVYGLLAGDSPIAERVCREWDDHLHVHYNSLLLGQFDTYVRAHYPDRLPPSMANLVVFDAALNDGDPLAMGPGLVQKLTSTAAIQPEACDANKLIQSALLANNLGDFVSRHGLAFAELAGVTHSAQHLALLHQADDAPLRPGYISLTDFDGQRVLCHLLFVLQDLGVDVDADCMGNIGTAYIHYLSGSGKVSLVPLYASRLSPERQLRTLAVVMRDVTRPDVRRALLAAMRSYDMDVAAVMQTLMKMVTKDAGLEVEDVHDVAQFRVEILEEEAKTKTASAPDAGIPRIKKEFMGLDVSEADRKVIDSFQWYQYIAGRWKETFDTGVSLFKRFFGAGRLAAARRLAERMRSSDISLIKTERLLGRRIDVTAPGEEEAVKQQEEQEEEEEEAAADENDEAEAHDSRRPSTVISQHEQRRQRRLHRRVLARQAKLYTELERLAWVLTEIEGWRTLLDKRAGLGNVAALSNWKREVRTSLDRIVHTVEPLLHGWLVDVPHHHRATLTMLRDAYLGPVVLAYHTILYTAAHALGPRAHRHLLECMNLATKIAAPDSDMLPSFVATGRLPVLVRALAASSKAILRSEENRGKRKRTGAAEGAAENGGGGEEEAEDEEADNGRGRRRRRLDADTNADLDVRILQNGLAPAVATINGGYTNGHPAYALDEDASGDEVELYEVAREGVINTC